MPARDFTGVWIEERLFLVSYLEPNAELIRFGASIDKIGMESSTGFDLLFLLGDRWLASSCPEWSSSEKGAVVFLISLEDFAGLAFFLQQDK